MEQLARLASPNLREPLEDTLGYKFQKPAWLVQALTHISCQGLKNNERLEFLGDAGLGLALAFWLLERFPEASEGALTRLRSSLVNARTLEGLARSLKLEQCLVADPSQNLQSTPSTLGDAFEALLGAIFMDGGYMPMERSVRKIFTPLMAAVEIDKDPKTRLQESCQALQQALPLYTTLAVQGLPPHETFTVECSILRGEQSLKSLAKGKNKKSAEQAAAAALLKIISDEVRP